MMQRSVNSVTLSPMYGLFGGVFFSSIIRLCGLPKLKVKSCSRHSPALSQTGQSSGWLRRMPSRVCAWAYLAFLLLVTMTVPSLAGVWQPGTTLGCMADGAVGLAFADFDQAHAAAGDDGERRVPAVVRNEHAGLLGGLDQVQLFVADIDRLVVDVDRSHR